MNVVEVPLHVKQAVLVQSTMLNDSRFCWLSKTQQIHNEAGLSFKFSMAGTDFTRQHVNKVMTQLSDQFVHDWYVQLSRQGEETRIQVISYKHTDYSKKCFTILHVLLQQTIEKP